MVELPFMFGLQIFLLCIFINYGEKALVFVSVFSAPEHFERRQSLRRTWLRDKNLPIIYKFVIGNKLCPIPPEERIDLYGCKERKTVNDLKQSIPPADTPLITDPKHCSSGFSFVAHYKLRITHLALPKCLLYGLEGFVRVKLKEIDGRTLGSATFYKDSTTIKAITPVTFPRNAEGVVVLEFSKDNIAISCCRKLKKQSDILFVTGVVQNSILSPFTERVGCPVIISFTVVDEHTPSAESREEWNEKLMTTNEDLSNEYQTNSDILFVNITDVYKNLPEKLVNLIIAKDSSIDFKFLMKTDDDVFVDLPRVIQTLRDFDQDPSKLWWWSSFKEMWHVPRMGKWKEQHYTSITYPPFPCGGGYVLSQGIIQHLASQARHLQMFQGEDVSLGIWLAGVRKITAESRPCHNCQISYKAILTGKCEYGCAWTCYNQHVLQAYRCHQGQLTVPQMYAAWDHYKSIGHL